MARIKRAWSVDNVLNAKFNGLAFNGEWQEVFGQPERAHSWTIIGKSGSGKTTFNFQLAKMLNSFDRVLYNSMEEGLSGSIQTAYHRVGLTSKQHTVELVQESMEDLTIRLKQHKSPNIVFIDSIKYTKMRWKDYEDFCDMFSDRKLLIWVGHVQGNEPKGALAQDIYYDSFVKIRTEGFRAFVTSRYSNTAKSSIDIWPEGAAEYWGLVKK